MSRNLLKCKLNQAKSISTFYFSNLCTTIAHNLLLKVLSEVVKFVFKSKVTKHIVFSIKSLYRTFKGAGRRYFTKKTLVNAMSFLINKCFYTLLVTWLLNKILVYQWVLTHHCFGLTSFFISLSLSV